MVPAASGPLGIVYVNGYTSELGWQLTGLDWETGETVTEVKFGHDNYGNGADVLLQFLEDGDLMFNSIAGPYRIRLTK